MTGLRDLVALLYRADWTQLSLSGELATRTDQVALRSLLAPSGGAASSADTQAPPRWREHDKQRTGGARRPVPGAESGPR